ncbi:MAG: DoxX family membrane protein [Bacteroidetes bacterium MedPE-SWsnd-G1]|nr:MAG: DoxX family membrane protein [Bacteroidetes bacterium MedPE-SWsnd-G1]
MKLIKKLNKWANSHAYYPIDILRIALGVFLIYKGVFFFRNPSFLVELLNEMQFDSFSALMWSVHYVGMFHFVGGLMLVFGLLTRLSLIVQLPIFIGAVTLNFFGTIHPQNLLESSLVFLVSIFFILYGSGKHSMDYDLKMQA